MVSSHIPNPTKSPLLTKAVLLLAVLVSLLSWWFVIVNNSLFAWIGLVVVTPYAAYQCHERLKPESRSTFRFCLWFLPGLTFTFNALNGSAWWLAYWPVSLVYLFVFNALNSDKAQA